MKPSYYEISEIGKAKGLAYNSKFAVLSGKWRNMKTTLTSKPVTWTQMQLDNPIYRQVSNISRTKSQHLKDYRTVLRLSLQNPLKPDVKSRMKM